MYPADLFIRDDSQDDGTEPNPRHTFWNSPDISLVDAAGKTITNLANYNGNEIFVKVKIHNIGDIASTVEQGKIASLLE